MTSSKKKATPIVFVVLIVCSAVIGCAGTAIWACLGPLLQDTVLAPPWRRQMNEAKSRSKSGSDEEDNMIAAVALADRDKSAKPLAVAKMHYELGQAMYKAHHIQSAVKELTRARDAALSLKGPLVQLNSDLDLAWCEVAKHDDDPDYKPSMKDALEAEALVPEVSRENKRAASDWMANVYRVEASLYSARNEYDKAESKYVQALETLRTTFKNQIPYTLSRYFVSELARGAKSDKLLAIAVASPEGPFEFSKAPTSMSFDSDVVASIADAACSLDPLPPRVRAPYLQQLLAGKKFDELEKIAADLRKSKEEKPNGYWRLDDFYSSLSSKQAKRNETWKTYLTNLDQWLKEKPKSATPGVLKGEYLINKAWDARGSGTADTVTQSGWSEFGEYLEKANKLLTERKENGQCPAWYGQMLTVGLGQGFDRTKEEAIVDDGLEHWPGYDPVRLYMVYYLQPRWYGQGDEWLTWITERCDRLKGKDGDKLYARTMIYVDSLYENIFDEFKNINYSRFDRGARALMAQYPKSARLRVELFCLYIKARRFDAARHTLDNFKM